MKEKTSIVFTGDIQLDRYMDGHWNDEQLISEEVMAFLLSGDHLVANVEGALIPEELATTPRKKGRFFHTMNPEAIKVLNKIKADVWCLANNHTMDDNVQGMESGLRYAKENGVQTIGAGMNIAEATRPAYYPEAGGIGIFAIAFMPECVRATETEPGMFPWDDFDLIEKTIREIKKTCRYCICVAHGEIEFTTLPTPYTRDRYLKILELGADAVIAHHPHVVMNYEMVGKKPIFYSLGNFLLDTPYQREQPHTDRGLLIRLDFDENGISFVPFGFRIDRTDERVKPAPIPDIFENIGEEDYRLLMPTSMKALLKTERKRESYLRPECAGWTEEQWTRYFNLTEMNGYYLPGSYRDFKVVYEEALRADEKEFESCRLEKVKAYIREYL